MKKLLLVLLLFSPLAVSHAQQYKPFMSLYTRVEGWNNTLASVTGIEFFAKGSLYYFTGLRFIYSPYQLDKLNNVIGLDWIPFGVGTEVLNTGKTVMGIQVGFLTGGYFENKRNSLYSIPVGFEVKMSTRFMIARSFGIELGINLTPQWTFTFYDSVKDSNSFQFRYGLSLGITL